MPDEDRTMAPKEKDTKPRRPGAWRHWKVPSDVFLEPMYPEDLDAAEGLNNDEWEITLPDKLPKRD
jgi:hypothetical protein